MTVFIIGLILFFGVHLIPMTPLKPALHKAIGENPYKGLFSLIALVGLGVTIWGFSMLRSGPGAFPMYFPAAWTFTAAKVLVFVGFVILAASHLKGHIKKIVRHPMSIGIALWSLGHLIANGRQAAVILFSCFLALSLLDIVRGLVKGTKPDHEPKAVHDGIAVVAGVALFAVFGWLHQYRVGIPLF